MSVLVRMPAECAEVAIMGGQCERCGGYGGDTTCIARRVPDHAKAWKALAKRQRAELRRLRELVRMHRQSNWGIEDPGETERLGMVLDDDDATLYRSVLGSP